MRIYTFKVQGVLETAQPVYMNTVYTPLIIVCMPERSRVVIGDQENTMAISLASSAVFSGFRQHPEQFHLKTPFIGSSKHLNYTKSFKLGKYCYGYEKYKPCCPVRCAGKVSYDEIEEKAKDMIKSDSSSNACIRWFTPLDSGTPPSNAPLLLYLPGLDGIGLGMSLHHQALGELFEVRCLHIPVMDHSSFEGLLTFVNETLNLEGGGASTRPIYLVGECMGGCLALAAAAHNPDIDLTLVLVNPATCFSRSNLQSWFPIMNSLSDTLFSNFPFNAANILGDLLCTSLTNGSWRLPSMQRSLTKLIPNESLLRKFIMLQSAALYANSRLHAIKCNVLVIASGHDQFLPSADEAVRLKKVLKNSKVRYFKDSGHSLLLEDGIQLATVIKGVGFYRHSRMHDFIHDFVPPTREEAGRIYEDNGLLRKLSSPVMFSTSQSGRIMKGLSGIPQGPILFVGIHMLMGFEIPVLGLELLKQRDILVRGLGHPIMFGNYLEEDLQEMNFYDFIRLYGAVPSSGKNLLKLLSSKSSVLLYPGGAREALHRKGEQYKLFWPEKAEFVRMAARFEATIVPFGIVGEDDIAEVLLDYEDIIKIPIYNQMLEDVNREIRNIRSNSSGEVANQKLYLPIMAPKPPGRLYFLFCKPIVTAGKKNELQDKTNAQSLYLHVKGEVEEAMSYLLRKREKDPYRHFLPRFLYEAASGFTIQMPTFDP